MNPDEADNGGEGNSRSEQERVEAAAERLIEYITNVEHELEQDGNLPPGEGCT